MIDDHKKWQFSLKSLLVAVTWMILAFALVRIGVVYDNGLSYAVGLLVCYIVVIRMVAFIIREREVYISGGVASILIVLFFLVLMLCL